MSVPDELCDPHFWCDSTSFITSPHLPPSEVAQPEPSLQGHVWFETSGSSGTPKWVALSKSAIQASATAVNQHLQVDTNSTWGLALPINHVGGFSILARAHHASCQLSQYLGRWNPLLFAEWLSSSGVTHTSLVPTQVHDLVAQQLRAPHKLIALVVGGGHLSPSCGQAARALGWPVLASYGMTEAGSQIATQPLSALEQPFTPSPIPVLPIWQTRVQANGCLDIRSAALCSGWFAYDGGQWQYNPITHAWHHTQDRVQITQDGIIPLGRADGWIKILGELVSPEAIEREIYELSNHSLNPANFVIIPVANARAEHALQPVVSDSLDPALISHVLQQYHQTALGYQRLSQPITMRPFPISDLHKPLRQAIQQWAIQQLA